MARSLQPAGGAPWRKRLFEIIFRFDTFGGRLFDLILIIAILLSIVVVILSSVQELWAEYEIPLLAGWWLFTILFTIEYVLRLICVRRPLRYALSFYGVVDFLAIFPGYLSLFFAPGRFLSTVRILRVLRIFRILHVTSYSREAQEMLDALKASRRRIAIFVMFIITLTVILGSIMYVVEAHQPGSEFTNIPRAIYWAVVTLSTVGYGDISPHTGLGRFIATIAMLLGYSLIIVPIGLVSMEFARRRREKGVQSEETKVCKHCGARL